MKAGEKVQVNFAGVKFAGEITRVGADKGDATKVQVKNLESPSKPLWYPANSMQVLDQKEYEFMFAGTPKKGVVYASKGDRATMLTENGLYPCKTSDITGYGATPVKETEKAEKVASKKEEPKQEEDGLQQRGQKEANEKGGQKEVKATILGEAVITVLQKQTTEGEEVDCLSVDTIAEGVGKTQPQVKAVLSALNDMGLVMLGVCDNNPHTVALTPNGFAYECGKPVDLKKLQSEGGTRITKKERIIALYLQGCSNKEIIEQVGCDTSYPSWLIKEEIKKGNLTPRD